MTTFNHVRRVKTVNTAGLATHSARAEDADGGETAWPVAPPGDVIYKRSSASLSGASFQPRYHSQFFKYLVWTLQLWFQFEAYFQDAGTIPAAHITRCSVRGELRVIMFLWCLGGGALSSMMMMIPVSACDSVWWSRHNYSLDTSPAASSRATNEPLKLYNPGEGPYQGLV